MKVQHIIGADLSKKTIDFAVHASKSHCRISNDPAGFKTFIQWLKQVGIGSSDAFVVMEHTGLYSCRLEAFFHRQQIRFTKVPALAIKNSMGIVRGKTDKMDAMRISRYGCEKQTQLAAAELSDQAIDRLQMLNSTRQKLVRQRASLKTAIKEYVQTGTLTASDLIIRSHHQLIGQFDKQIEKMDKAIEELLSEHEQLLINYDLLLSMKGVGKVLALNTIIKTYNFKRFTDARKFACYCGTAPFEYSSGTSVRGKTRVSHLADKSMKRLLDLAAKTAIQHDKELRAYYIKRTESGKSKMSTINVVRNKLLYRMFAIVKRQTPFVENYIQAA